MHGGGKEDQVHEEEPRVQEGTVVGAPQDARPRPVSQRRHHQQQHAPPHQHQLVVTGGSLVGPAQEARADEPHPRGQVGGPLQEELVNRLEQTIADFHEEVSEMMANLKENAEKRHEKLKEIWNNPDAALVETDNQQNNSNVANSEAEMSEWERRLEEAGKLGDSGSSNPKPSVPVENEAPKKKGLFGRKRK